jgi:bifunctional non-homologous end joining protein LigD
MRRIASWSDEYDGFKALPISSAILDGEAVVLDEIGRTDFSALQQALGGRGGKRSADEAIFIAFDLLYSGGHDLRSLDQVDRRQLLEDLVPGDSNGGIRFSHEIEGEGEAVFAAASEHGLEGIIAKHRHKPYRSGRGGEWLKIKAVQSEGFVIVGYEPSAAAFGGIGKVLLAARKDGQLTYVGGVGTGFGGATATALRKQMDRLVEAKPMVPMINSRKGVWVRPELVAEVEFRAWTSDGKLRHASYKGLREAADADNIYEIEQ